jgi:TPP-dependent pyruvate/acetoin dehydrogenase alpha subunit
MKPTLFDFWEMMIKIRRFEEIAIELYKEGLVGGSYHSYIGQEAVATGVCMALRTDDYITTTYRGRGQHLAKGADPFKLYAELLGKEEGYCKGKGGPMHIACPEIGLLGANGIVGAGVPIATGAAMSSQMAGLDRVSVAFFGDGAINQGALYEAANLAAVWKLPLILVCENNLYSEMTPIMDAVTNKDLADRAKMLGIHSVIVDGNDVQQVYDETLKAVDRARKGKGPTFIEAKTYRLQGHMYGDPETYRTKEEVQSWKAKDPLKGTSEMLVNSKLATEEQLITMEQQIIAELQQAANQAKLAKEPDFETIFTEIV